MRPEDWRQGMENEAASVEDGEWARETRRYLRVRRLFMPLSAICLAMATFPVTQAMTYGRFSPGWLTLLGLCTVWLSLSLMRHVADNALGRAGLAVMGVVGLAFTLSVIIPLRGTAAMLWLLGFAPGAALACLGIKPPYRAPLGLLTLPVGVWLLINFTSLPVREIQDVLLDAALFVAQLGWVWLGLLLLHQPQGRAVLSDE